MKKRFRLISCVLLTVTLSFPGCGHLQEIAKTVWGSSTRALEQARTEAIRGTYQCRFSECFKKILEILKDKQLEIFIQDKKKQHIVVMNVPGSVNTTEVGLFFSDLGDTTRIDITSLSSEAKETVAEIVFPVLSESCEEILRVDLSY